MSEARKKASLNYYHRNHEEVNERQRQRRAEQRDLKRQAEEDREARFQKYRDSIIQPETREPNDSAVQFACQVLLTKLILTEPGLSQAELKRVQKIERFLFREAELYQNIPE